MKTFALSVLLTGVTALASFSQTTKSEATISSVNPAEIHKLETMEVKNYFVKNTVVLKPGVTCRVFTNEKDFLETFGMAATMNNAPTRVDFTQYFVCAIMVASTDYDTKIAVNTVSQEGKTAVVNYTVTTGEKMSYTMGPVHLFAIPISAGIKTVSFLAKEDVTVK